MRQSNRFFSFDLTLLVRNERPAHGGGGAAGAAGTRGEVRYGTVGVKRGGALLRGSHAVDVFLPTAPRRLVAVQRRALACFFSIHAAARAAAAQPTASGQACDAVTVVLSALEPIARAHAAFLQGLLACSFLEVSCALRAKSPAPASGPDQSRRHSATAFPCRVAAADAFLPWCLARGPLTRLFWNQASAAKISSHVQQLAPLYARFLSEFDRSLAAAGTLLVGFKAPAGDRCTAIDAFVEPIRHIETYRSIVKILVSGARVACLLVFAGGD